MKINKRASTSEGRKSVTAVSRVVMRHKITSSVSAAAVVVAGSMIVSSHTSSITQNLQDSPTDLHTSQSDVSTNKDSIAVDLNSPDNSNEDTFGHTNVNVTPGPNTEATVRVNGEEQPADDNGNVHTSVPHSADEVALNVNIDTHNDGTQNTRTHSSSTLHINSTTTTHNSGSTQTTQINGRTVK